MIETAALMCAFILGGIFATALILFLDRPVERKQTPMGRIMGKWPGDETDEEVERALRELEK